MRRVTPSRRAEVDELLKENHSLSDRCNRLAGEAQDIAARAEAAEKRVAALEKHERTLRESQQRTVDDLVRARDLAVRDLDGRLAKCAELHGYAAQISAARLKGADAARREALAILARSRAMGWTTHPLESAKRDIEASLGKEPSK